MLLLVVSDWLLLLQALLLTMLVEVVVEAIQMQPQVVLVAVEQVLAVQQETELPDQPTPVAAAGVQHKVVEVVTAALAS